MSVNAESDHVVLIIYEGLILLISIVMPCFNGMKYIRRSIESVLKQTINDFELIIVDDGSTDKSMNYIHDMKDARIKVFSTQGCEGASIARNIAIESAKGKYIAFLDCDDEWLPNRLEEHIDFMERNNMVFSWSAYNVVDEVGAVLRIQNTKLHTSYHSLLSKRTVIGCLTAIYNADVLGKLYMPNLKMRQDLGLWLTIVKHCDRHKLIYGGLNKILANYRVHQGGMTKNKLKAAKYQWKLYREVEILSLPKSIFYFLYYIVNGILDRSVK